MLSDLLGAMGSMVESIATAPPTLLWGVFLRIYGLLFACAIGMLHGQIVALAGEAGLYPIKSRLERLRADHPESALRRFVLYPTLHWLWCSDAALQRLLLVGSLLGGGLVVTGVWSSLGLAIMWSVYLSYATSMNLMFPWDCLLLESAFLALFLPSLAGPASMHTVAPPGSLLAFCFRLLIFRLLFGFGKMKVSELEQAHRVACFIASRCGSSDLLGCPSARVLVMPCSSSVRRPRSFPICAVS